MSHRLPRSPRTPRSAARRLSSSRLAPLSFFDHDDDDEQLADDFDTGLDLRSDPLRAARKRRRNAAIHYRKHWKAYSDWIVEDSNRTLDSFANYSSMRAHTKGSMDINANMIYISDGNDDDEDNLFGSAFVSRLPTSLVTLDISTEGCIYSIIPKFEDACSYEFCLPAVKNRQTFEEASKFIPHADEPDLLSPERELNYLDQFVYIPEWSSLDDPDGEFFNLKLVSQLTILSRSDSIRYGSFSHEGIGL
jgi:hypothetical protein